MSADTYAVKAERIGVRAMTQGLRTFKTVQTVKPVLTSSITHAAHFHVDNVSYVNLRIVVQKIVHFIRLYFSRSTSVTSVADVSDELLARYAPAVRHTHIRIIENI